jgi:hypothetical protein
MAKNAGWLKSPIFICLKSMVITPKYFFKMKSHNQQIIKPNWGKLPESIFLEPIETKL